MTKKDQDQKYYGQFFNGYMRTLKVKIKWLSSKGHIKTKGTKLGLKGWHGNQWDEMNVIDCNARKAGGIVADKESYFCTDGGTVTIPNGKSGLNYRWSSNDVHIQNQWGKGAYFDYIKVGEGTATIKCTINGECHYNVVRTIDLTVNNTTPLGDIIDQGTNQTLTGSREVKVNCDGSYYLRMPYFNNSMVYRWYVNEELVHIGASLNHKIATSDVSDHYGKVVATGACGTFEYDYIARLGESIKIPNTIYTCENSVLIEPELPTGAVIYSAWSETGNVQVQKIGENYLVTNNTGGAVIRAKIGFATNGCSNANFVTYVSFDPKWGGGNGIAGGVLSDYKTSSGSDLVYVPNDKVYFVEKGGDIAYYYFDQNLQKWLFTKTGYTSNAKYDPNDLQPIVYNEGTNELYFVITGNSVKSVSLTNGSISDQPGLNNPVAMKYSSQGNVYAIDAVGRLMVNETGSSSFIHAPNNPVTNHKALAIDEKGAYFFRNGNLIFIDGKGITNTIAFGLNPHTKSSLEIRDGYVFYCNVSGDVVRFPLSDPDKKIVVNPGQNCSGMFVVGKTHQTVFFAQNETYCYRSQEENGQFSLIEVEGAYYRSSAIYNSPHVYYISGPSWEEPNVVCNLYSFAGCESNEEGGGSNDGLRLAHGLSYSEEDDLVKKVSVYPNPVSNYINLSASEVNVLMTKMYSSTGVFVGEYSTNSIDVSNFSLGVYQLQVFLENGEIHYVSFVKQ